MSMWTAFMLLLMFTGFYVFMSIYMIWRLASRLFVRRNRTAPTASEA